MTRVLIILSILFIGCKTSYILDKPKQRLPAPKSSFEITPETNVGFGDFIKEYISLNYKKNTSQKTKQLNASNLYHCCECESCYNPSYMELYGNILITKTNPDHCDSPKYVFEFIGYKPDAVMTVMKALFNDGKFYKWSENSYDVIDFEGGVYLGYLEIMQEADRTVVVIGWDVCF